MKRIKLLFSILLVSLFTLVSCQHKEQTISKVIKVRPTQSQLIFECEEAEEQLLEVFADGDWRITSEIPSWVKIYPTEGFGSMKVSVSVTDNLRDELPDNIRRGTIVFEGAPNITCEVKVVQLGNKFREIEPTANISAAIASADDAIIILESQTVVAAANEGVVIADDDAAIVVRFDNVGTETKPAIVVGDVVEVKSSKVTEQDLSVIRFVDYEGDVITAIGNTTPVYGEPATPDVDAYKPETSEYVVFNGLIGSDKTLTIGTVKETEGGSEFISAEKKHKVSIEAAPNIDFDELKNHEVEVKGYYTGQDATSIYVMAATLEDKGFVGKKLTKVLYYDDFNVQTNKAAIADGYVKDMHGAGIANTTYTAGPLVDFRNTYKQGQDGGTYKSYENDLYPGHSGMQGGSKHAHLYPCVTAGSGQSQTEDAWFQINDIDLCGSSAIQLGFGAFGMPDADRSVPYVFKYKFNNQTDWTKYADVLVENDWQWVSLAQLPVPAGATSVAFRGEATIKNHIRFDDMTLVGDSDGGFVEDVFELCSPSEVKIGKEEQNVELAFRTNIEFTHNLADYSEWITPVGQSKDGDLVTVTLKIAANDGDDRTATLVVKNEAKGKELSVTLTQEGGATKILQYVNADGVVVENPDTGADAEVNANRATNAYSLEKEGGDIVVRLRTNVTPQIEGVPSWATIKGMTTEDGITNVTVGIAPNTTSKVRNAVVRVYSPDVENDLLFYVTQDLTMPTGDDVLFTEDFTWMRAYFPAYEEANSGKKIGDSVGMRDIAGNSPQIYNTALQPLLEAFAAKGYSDPNASKTAVYANDAYLKFGRTSTGTRLGLPSLASLETPTDVILTFNYCFQVQGSGTLDPTELYVFVDGTKVNAEKLPTTQTGGVSATDSRVLRDLVWQTATVELSGITKDSKIEIGNPTYTTTWRFYLDNIIIKKVGGAPEPETIAWGFNAENLSTLNAHFSGKSKEAGNGGQYINANVSGAGTIEYYQVDKTELDTGNNVERIVGKTGQPYVTGAWPGDYWLTTANLEATHPAGTKVKYTAISKCSGTGMRYWTLEYKDGDEWKPAMALTTETDAKIGQEVTYNINHDGDKEYQIDVIFTMSNAFDKVEIRQTCTANAKANDSGALTAPNGGTHRFAGAYDAAAGTNTSPIIVVGVTE